MTDLSTTPAGYRPVIRLVSTHPGMDPATYLAHAIGHVYPELPAPDSQRLVRQSLSAGALTLVDHAALRTAVPDAVAELEQQAALVDQRARAYFGDLPDSLVSSTTSLVATAAPDAVPAGSVVWVRTGSMGTLQLAFPLLGVDLATGQVQERQEQPPTTPVRAMAATTFAAMDSGGMTAHSFASAAVSVASSVSWALPPPWNVGVTAGLSVLQMILGATDQPTGPSPMDQLKTSLEQYIASQDLKDRSGNMADFSSSLVSRTVLLDFTPDDIDSVGLSYLQDFRQFVLHDATGASRVHDDITHLLDDLNAQLTGADGSPVAADKVLVSCPDVLNLACTGVTLWLTGMKAVMQVKACQVSKALSSGDASSYVGTDLTHPDDLNSWWSDYGVIRATLLGAQRDGTVLSSGWADQLADWINNLTTSRLAQIGPVQEATHVTTEWIGVATAEGGTAYKASVSTHGWRFIDQADGDEWAHFFADTTTGGDACHSGTVVSHQADAVAAYDAHLTGVNKQIDDTLAGATGQVAAWKSKLADFAQQVPAQAPSTSPTVTVSTSGTATPSGLWVSGAQVQYAVVFKNEAGPSAPGPWSQPTDITSFAGATVSQIPQPKPDSNAKVWVLRRIQGGSQGQQDRTVKILDPGVASFVDTHD